MLVRGPEPRVRISEMDKDWQLDSAGTVQEVAESFALYLTEYPDISITFDGVTIDPGAAISKKNTYDLAPIEANDSTYPAALGGNRVEAINGPNALPLR